MSEERTEYKGELARVENKVARAEADVEKAVTGDVPDSRGAGAKSQSKKGGGMTERGICIHCGGVFTAHSVFDDLCSRCYARKYGAPEPFKEEKKEEQGDDGEGKEASEMTTNQKEI